MKLGIGLYRHMLNAEHYAFARQCGCTHVVVHLVDYFNQGSQQNKNDQPIGGESGWGVSVARDPIWEADQLIQLRKEIEREGLVLEAIENFSPADWHDVLLDGPKKYDQIEHLKTIIRNVGIAGIPIFGYNFSLAGVSSRITGPFARGQAVSVGMDGPDDRPIPDGMVWNMRYAEGTPGKFLAQISHEQLWDRLRYFLTELVPTAEQAGVRLAAHPDDPPLPVLRQTPRLVYQPDLYQRLLNIVPSNSNALEFCLGTISEMTEGDVLESVETYADDIAYIHFRNVRGKVPQYKEVFVDEGDIDMTEVLKILKRKQFGGVLIPDHTPHLSAPGSWYAGMAFTLGYMKAALRLV